MVNSKVGVVTVTYNSAAVIDTFLESTFSQTHPNFVLYIIDNASVDETLARVRQHDDSRIHVIANSDNRGFAAGTNQGIEAAIAAECDYVLMLNNDTEFPPELFAHLVEAVDRHRVDMCTPKIMFYDNRKVIWYAGAKFLPLLGYAAPHFGEGKVDKGQYDRTRIVDFAPSCSLLVRRNVFEKIGTMDERYFAYWEDTDFCYRAKAAGLKLLYYPTATLLHKVSTLTQGKQSLFSTRYGSRNRAFFIKKNVAPALQIPLILYCHLRYLLRYLLRLDDWRTYRLRVEYFNEGLAFWESQRAENAAQRQAA